MICKAIYATGIFYIYLFSLSTNRRYKNESQETIALLLVIVLAVTPMMGTVFAEEVATESPKALHGPGNNAPIHDYFKTQTFVDTNGHWAEKYINIAALANYMNGVGNQKFAPNDTVSRAMVAQVLYNLAGKPAINSYNPFKDVKSSDWYYKAVCWAYNKKITTGTSSTTFDPNAPVTREQMVTFLHRYVKFRGYSLKGYGYDDNSASLNKFSDKGQVSSFAKDAITWALGNHVVNGKSENTLAPRHSATRAELAKIIVMFAMTTLNPQAAMFARNLESCEKEKDYAPTLVHYTCKYSVPNLEDYYRSVFESCGISFGQYHGTGTHYQFYSENEYHPTEGAFGPLMHARIKDGSYSENVCTATTESQLAVCGAGTIDSLFVQKYGLSSSASSSNDDILLDGILYTGRSTVILDSLLMQDVLLAYAKIYANAIKSFCEEKGHSGKIYITNYQLFALHLESLGADSFPFPNEGTFSSASTSLVNCNISFFVE